MLLPEHLKMKVDQGFQTPTRANPTDAGFDIYFPADKGVLFLDKGESTDWIDVGISVEIPENWVLKIYPRSGKGFEGLTLLNTVGIIDHTYRKNIKVALYSRKKFLTIKPNERFIQGCLEYCPSVPLKVVESIQATSRGGFGSSGKF